MDSKISNLPVSNCSDSFIYHLVIDPFCKKLPTWQKVTIFVLHIIIYPLGIARLVYEGVLYLVNRFGQPAPASENSDHSKLKSIALSSLSYTPTPLQERPAACQNALKNAKGYLVGSRNEIYHDIEALVIIFNTYFELYKNNMDAAHVPITCMEIGYAISYYALENLDSFERTLSNDPSQAELRKKYLDAIFTCGKAYTAIASKQAVKPEWRILFNDMCDQIQDRIITQHPLFEVLSNKQLQQCTREVEVVDFKSPTTGRSLRNLSSS